MPLSARNQLTGKVVSVKLGDIMAHVVVKLGSNQIEIKIGSMSGYSSSHQLLQIRIILQEFFNGHS